MAAILRLLQKTLHTMHKIMKSTATTKMLPSTMAIAVSLPFSVFSEGGSLGGKFIPYKPWRKGRYTPHCHFSLFFLAVGHSLNDRHNTHNTHIHTYSCVLTTPATREGRGKRKRKKIYIYKYIKGRHNHKINGHKKQQAFHSTHNRWPKNPPLKLHFSPFLLFFSPSCRHALHFSQFPPRLFQARRIFNAPLFFYPVVMCSPLLQQTPNLPSSLFIITTPTGQLNLSPCGENKKRKEKREGTKT
ncbi:hypothetical protein ECC02_010732 [Trypanosoma cruzi]|uniref:Uncharacterized protein n=1 Tax=Trypanosoma cruzi TaxID=5693 RepID=A0A7J6XPZ5_TRYCR|nr:hypothetical protein ECC02_010732 [Trypanosoma cruzi]